MKQNTPGSYFFRYRSFTPIPLALIIIIQAMPVYPWIWLGAALMVAGEFIRLAAVRSSGKITRTRKVGAKMLVTWGLYSYTRNPLYIGNFMLWCGVTIFAGGAYMLWTMAVVLLFFGIQYSAIVALEEAKLASLFGERFTNYCTVVPRIFPRINGRTQEQVGLDNADDQIVRGWKYAFGSESSTLIAVAGVLILIVAKVNIFG